MMNIFFLALLVTIASILMITASELHREADEHAVTAHAVRNTDRPQAKAPHAAPAARPQTVHSRRTPTPAPAPAVFHDVKPAVRDAKVVPFRRKIELYTPTTHEVPVRRADDCSA